MGEQTMFVFDLDVRYVAGYELEGKLEILETKKDVL